MSRTTVMASSLPASMTSEQLADLFSAVGPIRSAFVAKDAAEKDTSRGFGFVRFVLRDDAQQALDQLHNSVQDGQHMKVKWAKRRHRETDDGVEPPEPHEKPQWAQAKEQHRARAADHQISVDASRTVLVRGLARAGDEKADDDLKKTLYKKAKKLLVGTSGDGELTVRWPLDVDGESVAHILTPNARCAHTLAAHLHNHIFKSKLLLCCQLFEREAVTRKGRGRGGARLIVRNLSWDVSTDDLAAVFARYGPLHSVDIPRKADAPDRARGFAFVWMLRRPDAEKAMAGINGTDIAPGYAAQRVTEGADNRKKSEKRKAGERPEKAKGRTVAVDWALSKDQWEAANGAHISGTGEVEDIKPDIDDTEDVEDEYGRAPGEASDGYLSEELSDSDESMFGQHDSVGDDKESVEVDSATDEKDGSVEPPASEDKGKGKASAEGLTLFVRNIQFEATEDELFSVFKRFGPVQYARIAKDSQSGRSRGTGFVHFYRAVDAERVLTESAKLASQGNMQTVPSNPFSHTSLLQADPSSDSARSLSLHGRVLTVDKAITKDQAAILKDARDRAAEKKDRRNLYLMREGVIKPDSTLAKSLHRSDLEARQSSLEARKALIRSNLSLYISRTRLSIRQLPLFVNDRILRKLANFALKAYDNEVKANRQPALTPDELAADPGDVLGATKPDEKPRKEGKPPPSRVRQAKVVRQSDRVDPVTGEGRSKGYGFVEVSNHADALRVLRWANANRSVGALFRGWWRDDLESQLAVVNKEPPSTERDARKRRLDAKALELKQEIERAEKKVKAGDAQSTGLEARSMRTLIIELSIENAVTVKRRQDRTLKDRVAAKKTSLTRSSEHHVGGSIHTSGTVKSARPKGTAARKSSGRQQKLEDSAERRFGGLGSAIGRKRKERRLKRGKGS